MSPSVSVVLTGSGGAGVMTAGAMLLEAASKAGWYAYMTRSSGPQIRGGEAAAMLRFSTEPLCSHDDHYDVLLAIDWQNVGRFAAEMPLSWQSLVIADPEQGEAPEQIRAMGARHIELPMKALAGAVPGGRPNMVALGTVAALIGLPEDALQAALRKSLARKGDEAVHAGLAALRAGAAAAAAMPEVPRLPAAAGEDVERYNELADQMTVHGNDEVAAFFRTMTEIEQKHVDKLGRLSHGKRIVHLAPCEFRWETPESPEALDESDMHYRMTPYQVISLAIVGEQQAAAFYAHLAEQAGEPQMRAQAATMADDEREHVHLLEKIRARYPKPPPDWDEDSEPPVEQEWSRPHR